MATGWEKFIGDAGRSISVEHFGASADADTLYREFGITRRRRHRRRTKHPAHQRPESAPRRPPAPATPSDGGTADRP